MADTLTLIIAVTLLAFALAESLTANRELVRGMPRPGWVLVILSLPVIGAVAWLVWGRPVRRERPELTREAVHEWVMNAPEAYNAQQWRAADDNDAWLASLAVAASGGESESHDG